MSFKAIHENKIIVKNSNFTVAHWQADKDVHICVVLAEPSII